MISFGLWIAQTFMGRAVNTDTAKRLGMWAAIPIVLLLVILLGSIGKTMYDNGKAKQVQDKRDAKVAVQTREADQKADTAQIQRTAVAEERTRVIVEAVTKTERKSPEKAARPVGDVQQSYFDSLPEGKKK